MDTLIAEPSREGSGRHGTTPGLGVREGDDWKAMISVRISEDALQDLPSAPEQGFPYGIFYTVEPECAVVRVRVRHEHGALRVRGNETLR
jgi:hypothetical protein